MMPGFFRDMPPRAPGRYIARADADVFTRLRLLRKWHEHREVTGQRRAYLVARWHAFLMDLRVPPDCDAHITWDVTRIDP